MANKFWTDLFGNQINPGNFIVYGCGRGALSYGVVKDYTDKNKIRIVTPHMKYKWFPGPGEPGEGGHYEDVGWVDKIISLSRPASITIYPINEVKSFTYGGKEDIDKLRIWHDLYRRLNG